MRPTRLELRGFTAFREPTVIDFSEADLFALSGPTGAGKSTLIDALCFALYGSVPRLDRRAVAPVISIDRNEARVRCTFTVGEETFAAARVVRRTAQGATTKEARLEDAHGEVLAGDADAVSHAVEDLLGLGFDQFITCVVLPQGDFARFLHDTPRGRQDLLVRLLDLGVYDRMRAAARERTAKAEARADSAAQQLADSGDTGPDALASVEERVGALTDLESLERRLTPRIDGLRSEQQRVRAERDELRGLIDAAAAVTVPSTAEAVDAGVDEATAVLVRAETARSTATGDREDAERARHAAGERGVLTQAAALHEQRAGLSERLERGRTVIAERRAAAEQADRAVATARRELAQREATRDELRRAHAAHAVRATLARGAPCPVCRQTVTELPDVETPSAVDEAERAHANAVATLDVAAGRAEAVRAGLLSAEDRRRELEAEVAELGVRLSAHPDPAAVTRALEELDRLDAQVTRAAAAERAAVEQERAALSARETARRQREEAWSAFDRTRDQLAALTPPPVERTSLVTAWRALTQWRDTVVADFDARLRGLDVQEQAAATTLEAAATELQQAAAGAGLVLGRGNVVDPAQEGEQPARAAAVVIAEALAVARSDRDRIRAERQRVVALEAALERHGHERAVAASLTRHLAANGFERWLLDEALQRLAVDASVRLRQLSGDQYSLGVDAQRNFSVIDHRAADEQRTARTLSGGETFLASLALALALADQIAELATAGTPRLESIFLDEGFGTLDPATLDTVADAIEELGAGGRTVGVVTHVRELAERLPVCFEVARTPSGATVQRVDR